MDWFLYDRDFRHKRVNNTDICNRDHCSIENSKHFKSVSSVMFIRGQGPQGLDFLKKTFSRV